MSTPAIAIEQVSKVYHSFSLFKKKKADGFSALDNVSFSIEQGEFFGLLGPNGAGKTTLISILAGLVKPTKGQAKIYGYGVQDQYRLARRALGVVPQELVFDPFFTVRETLRIQSGYFGIHHNDDWIDEILHHLHLTSKADTNMRALSGGMKRRVLVAQALVHRPPVILLDEPTAGVDVDLRRTLWAFISDLNRQGHTIVLTTHYLEEAETLCHRLAMLKQGRLVALDTTSKLLAQVGGVRVQLRLQQAWQKGLSPSLDQRVLDVQGTWVTIRLDHAHELEPLLSQVRQLGHVYEDIEVTRSDLEDAFIRLVGAESNRLNLKEGS